MMLNISNKVHAVLYLINIAIDKQFEILLPETVITDSKIRQENSF